MRIDGVFIQFRDLGQCCFSYSRFWWSAHCENLNKAFDYLIAIVIDAWFIITSNYNSVCVYEHLDLFCCPLCTIIIGCVPLMTEIATLYLIAAKGSGDFLTYSMTSKYSFENCSWLEWTEIFHQHKMANHDAPLSVGEPWNSSEKLMNSYSFNFLW